MISTTSVVAQTPKKTPGKTPPKTQEKKDDKTTETKPEIKKPTIPPAEKKRETVWQLIKKGGWTMLGLGLITSIIIALSLQRVFFFRRQKINSKGYFERIETALQDGGLEKVEKEIENDDLLLSRILRAGLSYKSHGVNRVEKAVEATASVEIGKLERGLNLLSNLGNLAPLLGFFGTVVGMRASFLQFVEKAAPTARDLAGGVEEALITTAAGLLIAIPTYLIYNIFIYYIDTVSIELERSASAITSKITQ